MVALHYNQKYSMAGAYYIVGLLVLLGHINKGSCDCGGGEWVAYKDEKCFIITDNFVSKSLADERCAELAGPDNTIQPTLSVASNEEQFFLTNLIFSESDITDSIWLGASRLPNGSFLWDDGSEMKYVNWAPGYPSADPNRACAQMNSHLTKHAARVDDGQWTDVTCTKRSLVVCQKQPTLTLSDLQRIVLQERRQLEELQKNPVPIGFVYVELPDRPDPQQIWPNVVWQDVTPSYAGLFFRAAGGNAQDFGTPQEENSPRLTRVDHQISAELYPAAAEIVANGSPSGPVLSGWFEGAAVVHHAGLSMTVSAGEVRPRNTAVRIWTRIL